VDVANLYQLVCDGKNLRNSVEPTTSGGANFIPQETLRGRLGSGENHERAVLRDLLGELDLNGVPGDPVGYAEHPENVFSQLQEQGADMSS